MKLSYIHGFGNKVNTFVAQDISTDSLPYQANLNDTPKYLTPDYFLPASSSESYYSKKYSCNHTTSGSSIGIKPSHQSKSRKITRVASVIMLSLGFLATALEVSGQQKDSTFEAIALSNNLPDIVPQLPLPDLVPSNPPVTPPPPPAPSS